MGQKACSVETVFLPHPMEVCVSARQSRILPHAVPFSRRHFVWSLAASGRTPHFRGPVMSFGRVSCQGISLNPLAALYPVFLPWGGGPASGPPYCMACWDCMLLLCPVFIFRAPFWGRTNTVCCILSRCSPPSSSSSSLPSPILF